MVRSLRALALVLSLLAAGCGGSAPEETAAPAGAPAIGGPDRAAEASADENPARPASPQRTRAPTRPQAGAGRACRDAGSGPEPDGGALKSFVNGRTRPIRDCYEHALKRDSSLRGRFTVRFTIGTCGEVSQLAIVRGHAPGELASCISGALRAWKLPFRPAEPVEVEYPFSFAAR
jgi:outer membrane biosynthesis protein TonB